MRGPGELGREGGQVLMRAPEFQHCRVDHGGGEVSVGCFLRSGSAGTVLYLHGLGASKGHFLPAASAEELSEYTMAGFDFPGFGETVYPAGRVWGIEDLVQITGKVIARLNLSEVVIIGHSLGGLVGLVYAHSHPHEVSGFVNIEGNLGPEDCFLTRGVARLSPAEFIATDHIGKLAMKLCDASDRGAREWSEGLTREATPQAFYDYSVSTVEWSDRADLLGMFSGLRIPKLFIHGSANNHLSYLPRLRASGVPVVEIPDSGHWPHVDNPEAFYGALSRFLGDIVRNRQ